MEKSEHIEKQAGYDYEDEIDLTEAVAILWRNKWFMLAVTTIISAAAAAYCLLATPEYEIKAQLRPGITGFNDRGTPVYDWSVGDIETWFAKESYFEKVINFLGSDASVPKIEARAKKKARIANISFYWPDIEEGKNLMQAVLDDLTAEGSKGIQRRLTLSRQKIEEYMHNTQQDIEHIGIEKERLDDEIGEKVRTLDLLKTQLAAIKKNEEQQRHVISTVKEQIEEVNRNTEDLTRLRKDMVKGNADKIALLMYSNMTQQNIAYLSNLTRQISDLEKEINAYQVKKAKKNNEIRNMQDEIRDLKIQREKELAMKEAKMKQLLLTLRAKLEALAPVEIVRKPFSSLKPAKPKKQKIITAAVVFGVFFSLILAFFREFWLRNRREISARSGQRQP